MKAENATCPPDPVLADFGLGKLDAASSDTVSQHLKTCADCRQRVSALSDDSFVNRLREARPGAGPKGRERTYVPGESVAGAGGSTDGSSVKEDGLPRPSRKVVGTGGQDGLGRPPHEKDGLGSPSSISAPPELANHPDYELLKELGRGGMGVVYLARNRMMDRLEVLKVVNKALLDRPEALERFQQEIRSAARLAHANIVAAYSVLRPGDLLVFAMEYVRGQDLAQVVKARGQLPVAHAAFYAHQVALGLQHAHEKGMVHRDIKPNNLMLAVEGKKHVVKILDFGLSKATSEKGAEAGLTKSGQILGTPDYVAPEQTLAASKADIRADIYSLGCTLYHLLSGAPPFQESSLYGILEAHQKRDPRPLNLVRPDVPVELATVVAKMMAKDPAKRYQTPAEVARALTPFFKPGQSVATPPLAPAGQSQPLAETAHGTGAATPASPIAPLRVAVPIPVVPHPAAFAAPTPLAERSGQFSVSIDTHRPAARRSGWWSTLPPWQQRLAVAGASALLLLGIAFLVRTPHGTIEIELSDPKAKVSVAVDGNNVDIGGLDDPLSLEVGEHDLKVKGKGYETMTKRFMVTKGKNSPLTITLKEKGPVPSVEPELSRTFKNSLGMEFVLVPKGKSWLGGSGGRPGDKEVVIADDFYLGKYEVTQEEWEKATRLTPSSFSRAGGAKDAVKDVPDVDLKRFPVEMVSWNDAQLFLEVLNAQAKETRWVYRLPKEAEWEHACRGGPTSNKFDYAYDFYFDKPTNQLLPEQANFEHGKGKKRTCKVGSYKPNRLGLYDMHGNVYEWCHDAEKTAEGASLGVRRSGCWHNDSGGCRAVSRYVRWPSDRHDFLGLRVARVPIEKNPENAATAPPANAARVNPPPLAIAPFDAKQALAHQEAWAKHLGAKVEIENSLGMKLRLIPPGVFTMGSPQEEINALVPSTTDSNWQGWFRSEGPAHSVTLTQAFYLGSCEVTQKQYREVIGTNPSHFSPSGPRRDAVQGLDTGQHPVENVSWFDAVDFCNKLSEKEQRPPYYMRDEAAVKILGGTGYRLPTEAEWEYGCRAGTTTRWSFCDNERDPPQHAWFRSSSGGRTHRVEGLLANPFGLYDLYGNVWEWCSDWHGEYDAGAVSDPTGPTAGSGRVFRGGSSYDAPSYCRSAARLKEGPLHREDYFGFRVARTIDTKSDASHDAATGGSERRAIQPPIPTTTPIKPEDKELSEIAPAIIEKPKNKADYDAIATGTWVAVMPGETELQDNWRAIPQQRAGDVIFRARVKKVSGQNLCLFLRGGEMPPRKWDYHAWFNGGNWFGVNKWGGGPKGDLGQWHTPSTFDDYFEFAFSAVGERLTIYANGKRVGEARDADYQRGLLGIGAFRGRSLFQDVEIMILDKEPPSADNTLTGDEKKAGWILLFDGKSLAGWMTSNQEPSKTQIEAGAVNPHKCGASMLIHEKTWENFELALDFKLSKGCNSGIFIRTYPLKPRPGKDVGFNGIEVALDDTTGAGYTDSGAIYGLAKPKRNAMKPVGDWNHAVITCDKNLITVELNGEKVTAMDLDQFTEPNRRPDGSPHMFDVTYRDHPRRGYIGLQDHGSPCWFKNIKLKELK